MFEAENSCNQGMTSIVLVEEIYAYSNGKPKIITEFLDELQTYTIMQMIWDIPNQYHLTS